MITLFYSSNCTSSRKAVQWLEDHQIPYVKRYIRKAPPSVDELKCMMQHVENGLDDILAKRYKPELFTISSPSTVSPRYHGRYCVFYFSPF
ncbi:hypothetical protein [Loigolactobacillus bifermentans]|uniref:hypothetical protein n=1 Tax=Loigolactobacillus bifermentans TaxID=1607 RepID=UPI0012A8FD38|nr:hypothetical protein [Loigolactobacillus bifermentans]QGG60597.1 hypothetical protein LB003_09050 [Loigolactobacillus bifermentans]